MYSMKSKDTRMETRDYSFIIPQFEEKILSFIKLF
jgi:hypothetical protein